MLILIFAMLMGFLATIILASTIGKIRSKKKSVVAVYSTLLIVSILVTGFSFGYSIHTSNTIVGDAKQVGMIDPIRNVDSGTIYYDSETDEYFYVKTDDWNLINPVYREVLDNEIAKKYEDAYVKLVDSLKEE